MPSVVEVSLILLFLGAAAFAAALAMSRAGRSDIERRIDLVAGPHEQPADAAVAWLGTRSKRAASLVRRVFAIGASRSWGMQSGALRLVLVACGSAAAVWLLMKVALGTSSWLAASGAAFASFLVPRMLLSREQRRAERQFTDIFPDAIDTAVRMLRAGLPISASIRFIGNTAPPPVNIVFTEIADQTQMGVPLDEALGAAGRQVGLADFRFFAVAIAMQRATGGNLAATLESLSEIIRKRRAMRLKARSTSAEIRVSAYVLGSIPFLIVAILLVIQPGYLTPLFTDPRGQVISGIAAGCMLAAFLTMRQMMHGVTKE